MRHVARSRSALCVLFTLAACGSEPADLSGAEPQHAEHQVDAGGAMRDAESTASAWDGSAAPSEASTTLSDGAVCGALSLVADQVVVEQEVEVPVEVEVPAPVALYVMLDRSLSMASGGLWQPAVSALTSFLSSADSSGIDVALQYFPGNGSCSNGSGYDTPSVTMGRLPDHANALISNLSGQSASGLGTPIEGALRGVTGYCKAYQAAHPDERCIAVLVTDGRPELALGCSTDHTALANIARDAWNEHQVRTFAVGLSGADFGLLDKIAQAGGASDCSPSSTRFACDVSSGASLLSDALASIRDTVTTIETRTELQMRIEQRPLACTWQMPAASSSTPIDKDRVNVTVSGGTTPSLELGRVTDASLCTANAWYYDSADAPTRIIACPATCDAITAAGHNDVQILLGCETRVLLR